MIKILKFVIHRIVTIAVIIPNWLKYLLFCFSEMNFGPDNIPDPDVALGSEDEKTFQYADKLATLPVPDLQHTLNRYLDSGKNVFL